MARLNRKGELWSLLSQVIAIRDKVTSPANTTLSAVGAAGAGTLTVPSLSTFAVGMTIRIGSGEVSEIVKIHPTTAPATTVITLDPETPLQFAHVIGDPVTEQALTDLGQVHSDGVSVTHGGSIDDIYVATARLLFAQNTGFANIMAEFGLVGYSVDNFATALGMLESRVLGAGTSTDPRTLTIDGTKVNEQTDIALRFIGARKDGTTVQFDLFGVEMDPTAFTLSLMRGQTTKIPMRAKVTAGALWRVG